MRLRGAKTELQEAGEDVDGMAESTSQLQGKLLALTHGKVDIMLDENTFKNTTQILREMADAWQYMTDIERAAALELMGGKRQANILSSLIKNFDTVESVIEKSTNSTGSALAENEKQLDSIQGKITQFTSALQTMWMNLLDSDAIKFVVDLGTAIIQLVDTLGLVPTALGAFVGFAAIKTLLNIDAFKGFTGFILSAIKSGEILTVTNQKLIATLIKEGAATTLVNSSLVQYAITSGIVTTEQVANMAATELLGTAFLGLAAKIKTAATAMMQFLLTTPVGWAILAVTAITAVTTAYNKFGPTHENFIKKLKEETDELQEVQSKLKAVQDELKAAADRIDELNNKDSLSFVEEEELNRLKEQTAELERQEQILSSREKRQRQEQIKVALQAMETDPNFNEQSFISEQMSNGVPYAAAQQAWNTLDANEQNQNNIEKQLAALEQAQKQKDQALIDLENASKDLSEAENALAETTYLAGSYEYNQIEKNFQQAQAAYNNAKDIYDQAEDRVANYNQSLDNIFTDWETKYGNIGYIQDATTEAEKAWNEYYQNIQDSLDKQGLINGDLLKSDVMDRIFGDTGSDAAQAFKTEFTNAIREGQDPSDVINSMLKKVDYFDVFSHLLEFDINTDDIQKYFTPIDGKVILENDTVPAQTYASLSESATNYQELLNQTKEVVANNTEVTQEYKDSLLALGVTEEELNECFDENNKLVVKDADALGRLVKSTKNNITQNVKLAKTQAQLQYQSLANKMRANVAWMAAQAGSYSIVSQAVEEHISMLDDQMEALDQLMQKYALLELSMSDAGQAYSDFETAKERDAELTYDESFLEMLKTIDEGLLNNETGTEAFEYAVKALVPAEVYEGLDDVDQKIRAIHDYIDGNSIFSRLFYVDEESGELDITADNVRAFVNEGLKNNVFTGDATDFDLSDDINGIKDVAEALGITEAAALAMFTALENVDAKWGDILTEVTLTAKEREIHSATKAIIELNKQLAEGKITAEEYAKRVAPHDQEIDNFVKTTKDKLLGSDGGTEDTSDDTLGFIELDKQATEAKQTLDSSIQRLTETQKAYNEAKSDEDTSIAEMQYYEDQLDKATRQVEDHTIAWQELINKRGEYPSEYEIQFVLSDIEEEIKASASKFESAIESSYHLDSNGYYVINTDVDITALEEKYPGIQEYIELLNSQTTIQTFADTTSAEEDAKQLETTIGNIIDAIETNLITLDLNEAAVQNIVDQTNKILSGIVTSFGVTISAHLPGWAKKVLEWAGFDLSDGNTNGAAGALGNAFASGTIGLKQSQHNTVVGELGRELVVDPIKGQYYTVGDHGTEMVDLPKGAIIYNHKQTKELLEHGHTSRGKYTGGLAFARGNAYANHGIPNYHPNLDDNTSFANGSAVNTKWDDAIRDLSNAADNISEASEEFEEVFDWIEVRIEEITESIDLKNAELENAIGSTKQNAIIDEIIDFNKSLYNNLTAGANEYYKYAKALLSKVPAAYRDAAQNGAIAIEEFVGEVDEKTLEAIQEYREWVQKGADATQQAEEVLTEIRSLAKQAFDNIVTDFENQLSLNDSKLDRFEAENSLLETDKGFESEHIFQAMMAENETKLQLLEQQQAALQAELNSGKIEKYTDDWYEAINTIAEVDTEIVNLQTDIEDLQDSINELHWEKFELLMKQFEAINDEADNLLDILGQSDAVDEFGNWTDEGITSLGLLAQKMEDAEMQAQQYKEEIEYLNANWETLGYTQEEYIDKLEELKSGQYEAIDAYHDAKDAISDLNKERVEAIKKGIEKEIDAYSELIEKKKEALDSDKDAHSFQKNVAEQQKNISELERQIAVLTADNSASARAQRARLESELFAARAELEETYYDRSIENQKEALDQELESFQEQKDKEIEGWEKYLENMELVVADSLAMVQENTRVVLETLTLIAQQYGLTVTDSLIDPWKAGEDAIQDYGVVLNMSLTQLASLFGLTVDEFAAKLDLTTEGMISKLGITVAEMAKGLGLTNEQLAAKLGITTSQLSGKMNLTIQEFATQMGLTIPQLAKKLGTTTSGLVGNLDMTMTQFAGRLGYTVDQLASKFGLTSKGLASKLGQTYQQLTNPFGMSMSATVDALKALEKEYQQILKEISNDSIKTVSQVNHAMKQYKNEVSTPTSTTKKTTTAKKTTTTPKAVTIGSKINAGSAKIYADSYGGGAGKQYYGKDPIYTVVGENNGYWLVRYHKLSSGYTGWFKKSDVKAYAKGTLGTPEDQFAWLDELGEELVMHADGNGRLSFLTKGTSVIPADLTKNLMQLGQLNPQDILDRSRPVISAPHITNNNIELTMEIAEVVHIEHMDNDTLPNLTKAIDKQLDKYMKNLNNQVRKYSR